MTKEDLFMVMMELVVTYWPYAIHISPDVYASLDFNHACTINMFTWLVKTSRIEDSDYQVWREHPTHSMRLQLTASGVLENLL